MLLLFNFTFAEFAVCETDLPSQTTESKQCPQPIGPAGPAFFPQFSALRKGDREQCLMRRESWPVTRSLSPFSMKFGLLISFLIRRWRNARGKARKRLIGKKSSSPRTSALYAVEFA